MKYTTNSVAQTHQIAKQIANLYHNRGGLITLQGPLGAGKTTFVQAFAKALGIKQHLTSPTFILARQYNIPKTDITLHHLDLYRLDSSIDLRALDLEELLSDPTNLILIEWPEKILNLNQLPHLEITISLQNPTSRQIETSDYHPKP